MRAISCNKLNYLFYYYEDVTVESHIPELSRCSIVYHYYYESMGVGVYILELNKLHVPIHLFYHRLGHVLYNILDKDGYFYEDD